jgi:hypothetical protein
MSGPAISAPSQFRPLFTKKWIPIWLIAAAIAAQGILFALT